jgi:hypothetical protein
MRESMVAGEEAAGSRARERVSTVDTADLAPRFARAIVAFSVSPAVTDKLSSTRGSRLRSVSRDAAGLGTDEAATRASIIVAANRV